jgi:AraC family transcriptional regulator of adaptative response / methylphosphotriester-DNA alkyltransferase methyltransferase
LRTTYAIISRKQANINAQKIGMSATIPGLPSRKTERRRKALLARAQEVIRRRYAEFDLSLAAIAEDVGCSTRQLQLVFRMQGDTDFRSYLLRVRMEQAHRLLSRKKNLTVRAAARAVGYREASGLRQAFVRFYGYNPSTVQPPPPDYSDLRQVAEARKKIS